MSERCTSELRPAPFFLKSRRWTMSDTLSVSKERAYWRRKLPHGFQYYLQRLARRVIRGQPGNVYQFAAEYLEQQLRERSGNSFF